jgi:uncharacterized protein YgbK (DUF1537 family)
MDNTQPNPPQHKGGKRREGLRLRVVVSGSVSAETDDQLNDWLDQLRPHMPEKASIGRVLERLVAFGVKRNFNVLQEPEKKGRS